MQCIENYNNTVNRSHPLLRVQRDSSKSVPVATRKMDSDLEAFSHNPTDGSFAPLAV